MNNEQLHQILNMQLLNENFNGFFRISEVLNSSKILKSGFYIILINKHWILIFMDNYNSFYYDSLGKPPSLNIRNLFFQNGKVSFTYNKKCHQNNGSVLCGLYCIHVLEQYSLGVKFKHIMSLLNVNMLKNELMLIHKYLHI